MGKQTSLSSEIINYIWFIVFIVVVIIAVFMYDFLTKDEFLEERQNKLNEIYNKTIQVKVRKTFINHGELIIEDYNYKEYSLMDGTNYKHNPNSLCLFVEKNDSIFKPGHSYDLFVYRNGIRYYFKIGKEIDKDAP